MSTTTDLAIIIGGAAVVAFVIYRAVPKVAEAAAAAVDAVNPLNHDNAIATGVNNLGAAIAGQAPGSWSLGAWLYEATHPDELAPAPARNTGSASGSWAASEAELETARLLARYPAPAVDAYERPPATASATFGSW